MISNYILPVIGGLLLFILGFIAGWFAAHFRIGRSIPNWERSLITVGILIAYLISLLLDIALNTYETPLPLHGVMGAVVGYYFENNPFKRKDS